MWYLQAPKECPEAIENSVKIAEILIENGCDPAVVNKNGFTPLTLAVQSVRIIIYLRENNTLRPD